MGLLQTLGQGQGYLKAGLMGFSGSGKTYTAVLLATGTRAFFGLDGPIAMFDTESGSEYVASKIKLDTGKELLGIKARSLDDLMTVGTECLKDGVSVLIVDSVTHIWRELTDAYLKQVNENRARMNLRPRKALEFQDWNGIKQVWNKWTDFYLNTALHIVICGRAGFEWEHEVNEETGKKELMKVGVKMKVEGEFGFEPSLLIEMEREQEKDSDGGFHVHHRATVLKDRFSIIDGATCLEPTFEFFKPHVSLLTPGAHHPIDMTVKTDTGVSDDGDTEWARERKTRVILCEEIQGEIVHAIPGLSAEEKRMKADLLHTTFGTRSWTAVESMASDRLRVGLSAIREHFAPAPQAPSALAVDNPVCVFEINGTEYQTRGATRDQMLALFDMAPKANKAVRKGYDKELLKHKFGITSKKELTQEQAEQYLLLLQDAAGTESLPVGSRPTGQH